MREPLSIAVAQPPCVPYDVAANATTHAAAVRAAAGRTKVRIAEYVSVATGR